MNQKLIDQELVISLEEEILKMDPSASDIVDDMIQELCDHKTEFETRPLNEESDELVIFTSFKNIKVVKNFYSKRGNILIKKAINNLLKKIKNNKA